MMTSKKRINSAIEGTGVDHIPLVAWCFGIRAPKHLRWQMNGHQVNHWYSMRLEHLHTLDEPWKLEDDFKLAQTWLGLGVDGLLDVSVPWSTDSEVVWQDSQLPAGRVDQSPVLVRDYQTPSGSLRHAIRQTGEDPGAGWVIQPECVPLFEDYNIPRAAEHAVSSPPDVPIIKHLYAEPDSATKQSFADRMKKVREFSEDNGVFVQAWSAFGMDAVVWLAGTQGAIMMACDDPKAFRQLIEEIAQTDYARTELALSSPCVDMVVQRGWYSSTDLWSPKMFDEYVFPHIKRLADLAHRHGRKFGYVMTTGVEDLGSRLVDAGVDVLYFVDPLQDGISLAKASESLGGSMTLAGGINSLTLASGNPEQIKRHVREAVETLGPTNRAILQPVDALFPDTPWEGVECMIETWKEYW